MLTEEGDIVLDPFAGSNTTGAVAETLKRYWIAVDNVKSYLEGSQYRFDGAAPKTIETAQAPYQMSLP